MSQAIPLPEETTRATETGLDKSKPHPLPAAPHEVQRPSRQGPAQDQAAPPAEEHPLSVGKP